MLLPFKWPDHHSGGNPKETGIKEGRFSRFIEPGMLISPQEVVDTEGLDQIGQIFREKGLTTEELIESGREIRGKLLQEEHGVKTLDKQGVGASTRQKLEDLEQ